MRSWECKDGNFVLKTNCKHKEMLILPVGWDLEYNLVHVNYEKLTFKHLCEVVMSLICFWITNYQWEVWQGVPDVP